MIDFTKAAEQERAIRAVIENNYNGTVLASVGFGKNRVIIKLLKRLKDEFGFTKMLYLCDNRRLRDIDFPSEVDKWADGDQDLKKMIRCECYQTAYKWANESYDVVIGDELDFAITKQYIKVFFNNNFKKKICFTGTMTKSKMKVALTINPIVYTMTTTEAENKNLLNKSKYYTYNYRMTEAESQAYVDATRKLTKAMAAGSWQVNKFMSERRELLFNLDSSVSNCRKIMKWLWDKDKQTRLVIFSERTAQADRLCRWSYHGGNEKLDNLEKFQNNEISGISVVSKIKRGINLKNANTAIFEMLGGTSTTEFEQKNGRMKRLPVSQIARVIFMVPWYCKKDAEGNLTWHSTVVENWLYQATCNLTDIEFINLKL